MNSHFRFNFKEWCANKRDRIPTEVCELPLSVADQMLSPFSFHSFYSVLILNFSPSFFFSFSFFTTFFFFSLIFILLWTLHSFFSLTHKYQIYHIHSPSVSSILDGRVKFVSSFQIFGRIFTRSHISSDSIYFIGSNVRYSVYQTSKTEPLKCFIVSNCTSFAWYMSLLMVWQPEAKKRFM